MHILHVWAYDFTHWPRARNPTPTTTRPTTRARTASEFGSPPTPPPAGPSACKWSAHQDAAVAKRLDIAATGIHHGLTVDGLADLDLSYTPPLGSPWDAVQMAAHAWGHAAHGQQKNNLAGAVATPARTTSQ